MAISTRGRDQRNEWVTIYELQFSDDRGHNFEFLMEGVNPKVSVASNKVNLI